MNKHQSIFRKFFGDSMDSAPVISVNPAGEAIIGSFDSRPFWPDHLALFVADVLVAKIAEGFGSHNWD